LGSQASHHAEQIRVAHVVAELYPGLQVMLVEQSANACLRVGGH
jgi:hypothetical protein